jgi:uncharacterized protein YsxB (DUF464 family)
VIKLLFTLMAIGVLGYMGWSYADSTVRGDADATNASHVQMLAQGKELTYTQIKTLLEQDVTTPASMTSPPQTLSGTLSLKPQGTATFTATLVANVVGATPPPSPAVYGGGVTNEFYNFNNAQGQSGTQAVNEATYRVAIAVYNNGVTGSPAAQAHSLVDAQFINGNYGMDVQLLNFRADSAGTSAASVGYADAMCGDSTIGCTAVTTGADTTVLQIQKVCQQTPPPDVQDGCTPTGLPTPTPQPNNAFVNRGVTDQANSGSAISP